MGIWYSTHETEEVVPEDSEAAFQVARNWLQGMLVDINFAERCCRYAIDKEVEGARNALALIKKNHNADLNEYLPIFEKAIEEGCPIAPYNLGQMYLFGNRYVDVNIEKAEDYYWTALERGNDESLLNLGEISRIRGDHRKVLEFNYLAIDRGIRKGYRGVAICYWKGYSVEKDLYVALWNFFKARDVRGMRKMVRKIKRGIPTLAFLCAEQVEVEEDDGNFEGWNSHLADLPLELVEFVHSVKCKIR